MIDIDLDNINEEAVYTPCQAVGHVPPRSVCTHPCLSGKS